jgi:hypothetical protein
MQQTKLYFELQPLPEMNSVRFEDNREKSENVEAGIILQEIPTRIRSLILKF